MKRNQSVASRLFDVGNMLFMLAVACIMIYPFVYVFSYSVSDPSRVTEGLIIWPNGFSFEAYNLLFGTRAIAHSVLISVLRTIIGPILMIIFTSMAAYVITKDKLPGVRFMRLFFVFTMYFGGGLIPTYILIKNLGMTQSFWVYVVPGIIAVFNMILIKTYIENLPESLEEAGLIDGANEFVLFWKIIFPICTPVLAATGLFTAVDQWNSFIDTQIYNTMSDQYYTMQYMLYQTLRSAESLAQAKSGTGGAVVMSENLKMAITVVTLLPVMIGYPLLQRHFTKGLLVGSIKG